MNSLLRFMGAYWRSATGRTWEPDLEAGVMRRKVSPPLSFPARWETRPMTPDEHQDALWWQAAK